eukprot:TRINITY_DN68342_c0_g1_i1.p1 TRINITY_DN68342_c0_g1~~TRINITY_DN68342_c0_g1_i1.p1  ORF type:complete len:121 (+),score=11.62 TRINITY_DN68342_c0_g1_i1:46-363(+)
MRLGLATGMVHHGDVGTNLQRFVTAAGSAVEAALEVWHAARDTKSQCLYVTVENDKPVIALRPVLVPSTVQIPNEPCIVYKLCQEDAAESDSAPTMITACSVRPA